MSYETDETPDDVFRQPTRREVGGLVVALIVIAVALTFFGSGSWSWRGLGFSAMAFVTIAAVFLLVRFALNRLVDRRLPEVDAREK